MLTKELLFNYNHLERQALFYKIIVISYGIQAYIILLKSGVDGGCGLNLNMFESKFDVTLRVVVKNFKINAGR